MNLAAFYHSGMYPEIYAPDRFHLRFSFRAASGDIETCTLVYFHKNHRDETTKEERMLERYHLGPSVVYVAVVSFQKPARYLQYYFRVTGKDGDTRWYNAWGTVEKCPDSGFSNMHMPISVLWSICHPNGVRERFTIRYFQSVSAKEIRRMRRRTVWRGEVNRQLPTLWAEIWMESENRLAIWQSLE